MLCANINNNGEVVLINDVINLATYEDLIDELSLTGMKIEHLTMVKNGVVIWYEEECEMDFVRFVN